MFPATCASSGHAFLPLPLARECAGVEGRATESRGEPRKVSELQALPGLRIAGTKAGPETFITTTTGERLSFGCAGPTKIILFMCFQALKNSFRAHQWGVNRNFEIRKMPAG